MENAITANLRKYFGFRALKPKLFPPFVGDKGHFSFDLCARIRFGVGLNTSVYHGRRKEQEEKVDHPLEEPLPAGGDE
jgi:hypothetical protein